MKIDAISLIDGMSGKLNKREKVVFSKRYGNIHAWEVEHNEQDPTAAQISARTRFSTAATKAAADMADPEKKAEWQEVEVPVALRGVDASARGVAASAGQGKEEINILQFIPKIPNLSRLGIFSLS